MRLEKLKVVLDEDDLDKIAEKVSETFWDLDEDKNVEECKNLIKTDCNALCDSLEKLGIEAKDPELMKEVNNVRDELAKYCEDTFAFTKTELAKTTPDLVKPLVPSYQIKDDVNFEEELIKLGAVYDASSKSYTIDVEFENQFGSLYLEEEDLKKASIATLSNGEEGIVIDNAFYKIVKPTLITDDFETEGENYFNNNWKVVIGHANRVANIKGLLKGIPDKAKYDELKIAINEIAYKYDDDPTNYNYNQAKTDLAKLFNSYFKSNKRNDEDITELKKKILARYNNQFGTNKKWSELPKSITNKIELLISERASDKVISAWLDKIMGSEESEEELDISTYQDMLKKYLNIPDYKDETLKKLELEGLKDYIGLGDALKEIEKIFKTDKELAKKYLYRLHLDINSYNSFPFMRSEAEITAAKKEIQLSEAEFKNILNNVKKFGSKSTEYQGSTITLKDFFEDFYSSYKKLFEEDKDIEAFTKRVKKLVEAVKKLFYVDLEKGESQERSPRLELIFNETFDDPKYYTWYKNKVSQTVKTKFLKNLDTILDNQSYIDELKSAVDEADFAKKLKTIVESL